MLVGQPFDIVKVFLIAGTIQRGHVSGILPIFENSESVDADSEGSDVRAKIGETMIGVMKGLRANNN